MVREDLADARGGASEVTRSAAAHPVALLGVVKRIAVSHDDVSNVQIVHVLLENIIAAEPDEVVPVADLALHFGRFLTRAADRNPAHVPIDARVQNVAPFFVVEDLADAVEVRLLVAALHADADLEVFLVGQFVHVHQHSVAVGVHAARFFQETVEALFHGVFIVDRAESRRGRENGVHCAVRHGVVDRLAVGVETVKTRFGAKAVALQGGFFLVRENVAHGDDFRVGVFEEVGGGAGPASTAADDHGFNGFVGSLSVGV